MHEHITHAIYYFEVHLVYSSIVWFAAWALTSIPGGSATTKHWIWLATALNFILPLGAMLDALLARYVSWATPLSFIGTLGVEISENASIATALCVVWLMGTTVMLARLGARIATEHCSEQTNSGEDTRVSRRSFRAHGVPVRFAESRRGPSVNGILRSHILVTALAKLANPDEVPLLRATATSFLGHRLVQLTAARPPRISHVLNALLAMCFFVVFVVAVTATIAHTACCFVART